MGSAALAVLFDLDCTLTDRVQTVRAYARYFVRDYGARFRIADERAVADELLRLDENGYNPNRSEDLAAHAAFIEAPSVAELTAHWFEYFAQATVERSGARVTLEALRTRGLRLGLITNGPRIKQQHKVDVLGVRHLFDTVLVSAEVGLEKPDPRIFHRAAEELGVEPTRCLFVGDNPEKDVLGAEQAGMQPVWIPAELGWPESLPAPSTVIRELRELLDLPALRP